MTPSQVMFYGILESGKDGERHIIMDLCGDRRRPSFRSIKLEGSPRRLSSVAAIGSGKAICVDYSGAPASR